MNLVRIGLFASLLMLVACTAPVSVNAPVAPTITTISPAAIAPATSQPTLAKPTVAPTLQPTLPLPTALPTVLPTELTPQLIALAPMYVDTFSEAQAAQDAAGNPVTYVVANTVDGLPETAWRMEGDGVGEKITVVFPNAVQLSELKILPGYAKIDARDGTNRFVENRRVRKVELRFGDRGPVVPADLEDRPELQSITFPPIVTSFVEVVILETTGHGGRDFTAISEIVAIGQSCASVNCPESAELIDQLIQASQRTFALPNIPEIAVSVEMIIGDYARVMIYATNQQAEIAPAYLKREQGTWNVVTYGSVEVSQTLRDAGFPEIMNLDVLPPQP